MHLCVRIRVSVATQFLTIARQHGQSCSQQCLGWWKAWLAERIVGMSANQDSPDQVSSNPKPQAARKWYSLRMRVLLLVPLALLVAAGIVVPRQLRQQRAIAALKQHKAVIRTQPASLLGA